MARIERLRKLRRLEGRAGDVAASVTRLAEARRDRALAEALALLGDADLRAVGALVDAAEASLAEAGKPLLGDGGTVDLWRFAREARDRAALQALQNALRATQSEADKELVRGERHA